jgi:Uma2 family endonuclease
MIEFSEDAQAAYGAAMDKATFLAWVRDKDGRYELDNGRVVMQARITRAHSTVANEFVAVLRSLIDADKWGIHTESFGIEAGNSIRYPDVMVETRGGELDDMTTDEPLFLVEVLSPSSVENDFVTKPAEYLILPSLQIYIVASQDAPKCWVWQRDPVTGVFPDEPVKISGRDAVIDIAVFGIALPLCEIYRHIGT